MSPGFKPGPSRCEPSVLTITLLDVFVVVSCHISSSITHSWHLFFMTVHHLWEEWFHCLHCLILFLTVIVYHHHSLYWPTSLLCVLSHTIHSYTSIKLFMYYSYNLPVKTCLSTSISIGCNYMSQGKCTNINHYRSFSIQLCIIF